MSREDLESRGAKISGGNNNASSVSSYVIEERDAQWTSWLIPMFVVVNVALFVVAMYINDCPKHKLGTDGKCVARFLGRFSFQPLNENPLFGWRSWELLSGRKWCTNTKHGGLSLVSGLHAGIIHLLVNMLCLVFIGIRLEQQFGFVRIGIIYLLSGFGGSILSALFLQKSISVGASGALFGLLGAMLSELITNWTIYTNKVAALLTLIVIVVINLGIGILPHVDNFAHIGGFVSGFFLGFILLLRPQYGWVTRRNLPVEVRVKSKYKPYQYVLWSVSLILLVAGFAVGLVMLFRGVNANDHCHWCHYLSCVPTRICEAMGRRKVVAMIAVVFMLLSKLVSVKAEIDCATVTLLVSACSMFVRYGSPDPFPGSPCCEAVGRLNGLADSSDDRQSVCRCFMGLITNSANATAIATLPGFCGVFLGFTIDPNTDCNL
ncbi:hypothetical protein HYC85_013604 [Camellia sinensis]|uniref:Multifunctional fusion protein n=1 Tax=Camellia sinensis TaxID=4442 RepID=A0A7J7H520_CAMSI|nr:hypothetical protein HYC85_013604 [Camellia sinensis]